MDIQRERRLPASQASDTDPSFADLYCSIKPVTEGVRQKAELRSVSHANQEVKELIDRDCREELKPEKRLSVAHIWTAGVYAELCCSAPRHLTKPRVKFTKWDYKVCQIIVKKDVSFQRYIISF